MLINSDVKYELSSALVLFTYINFVFLTFSDPIHPPKMPPPLVMPGLQYKVSMSSHVTITTDKQNLSFPAQHHGCSCLRQITRVHDSVNTVFMTHYRIEANGVVLTNMAGVVCYHGNP